MNVIYYANYANVYSCCVYYSVRACICELFHHILMLRCYDITVLIKIAILLTNVIYIQYVPNNVLPLLTRFVFSGDVTVYRESLFVLGIPTSYSRDIQRNS